MDTDYCNCENVFSIAVTETGFICAVCKKSYKPLSDGQKKIIESLACKFEIFVYHPCESSPDYVAEELQEHKLGSVYFSRD